MTIDLNTAVVFLLSIIASGIIGAIIKNLFHQRSAALKSLERNRVLKILEGSPILRELKNQVVDLKNSINNHVKTFDGQEDCLKKVLEEIRRKKGTE